jgi:hypothetical protein
MFDKLILLSQGGLNPLIAMNPADFILDLASGNTNDMSIPPELEKETKMSENGGRPSPIAVHEVCNLLHAPCSLVLTLHTHQLQPNHLW